MRNRPSDAQSAAQNERHRGAVNNRAGSPDDIAVWYSPLTFGWAQSILDAEGRPDLSFLEERPSFMEDREGVSRVTGQPTRPMM